jgi:hypothetical protein
MPFESWLYTMTIGWELYMEWGARKVTLSIENRKKCRYFKMKVLGRSHQSARKKSLRKKTLGKLSIPNHSYYCMDEKKMNRARWILWILLIWSLQREFRSTPLRADVLCQGSEKNIPCLKMKLFYLLETFNQFPTFFISNDYSLQSFPWIQNSI